MSAIDRIRQITRRQSNGFEPSPSTNPNYSDPHGRDKVRLGREMERDLGHYSFNNSSADANGSPRRTIPDDYTRDYSMDYKGGDTVTGDADDFFPRSPAPSTNDLDKHFRDFSMHGVDTSMESVEMPRGAKEMGSPELDSKEFDRPAYSQRHKQIVDDHDLSSQLHSTSSHSRSNSLSDFGDMNKRPFSPIEKFGKSNLKEKLAADLDRELKTASTPRVRESKFPDRPRSAFVDRYAKPSPPFRRPGNPVARTMEKEYTKPAASTIPRSFKDTAQLFDELGITTTNHDRETPARNQSFRLPDMTGIQSLIDSSPNTAHLRRSSPKHYPISSVPIPQDEKDIISGLRVLQDKVKYLTSENNHQKTRVRELENELRHQKRLYDIERTRANENDHQMFRRSSGDSGFGSVGDPDEALERQKASHAKDRMKLVNQLETLKSKITLLEAQLDSERERTRNLQEERDEAVEGMAIALNETAALKSENRALKAEILKLRSQSQEYAKSSQSQRESTAKERVKERVEAERRKDKSLGKRVERESDEEANRSFIQPDEIEELRKEIRTLRATKNQTVPEKPESKTKSSSSQTIDQTTRDAQGNVQTIRIQLENAKDRKDKSGKKSKYRNIRRVLVESDHSSDEGDADVENDVTSDSSDEDYEEVLNKAKKNIPIRAWLHPPGQAKGQLDAEIQNIIDGLAKHNSASCTVCSRKRRSKGAKNDPFSRKPLRDIHLNDMTEPMYEEGESIRPSVPPKQALSTVLSQLKDEFHHLQLQYRTLTTQYEGLEPGRGKRKRKAIAEKLRDILEEFEAKADQIYALYDVVEGARQDGLGGHSRRGWLEL